MRKIKLKECIIVGAKFSKENLILAKNRDRSYTPNVRIVHRVIDLIEMAYMEDLDTGWLEGMNEYGIGVVNSALLVTHDEKEKKIVKTTGMKSEDAPRILKALSYTSLEDAVHSIAYYDSGVKGHTLVGNQKNLFHVECTGRHDPVITKIKDNQISVQTNHGLNYQDIGYQHGLPYLSSKVRKSTIENLLDGSETAESILDKLNNTDNEESMLNPIRDTKKMSTTSQIAMDLRELIFYFRAITRKCNFKGIKNILPSDHEPKIKIDILDPLEFIIE